MVGSMGRIAAFLALEMHSELRPVGPLIQLLWVRIATEKWPGAVCVNFEHRGILDCPLGVNEPLRRRKFDLQFRKAAHDEAGLEVELAIAGSAMLLLVQFDM